jgi:hypothetical protein
MNTFFKVAGMALAAIGSMMFSPLFWFVIVITSLIYKRNSKLEYAALGYNEPLWQKVLNSLLAGLLAGILGSGISVLLGLTIEQYVPGEGVYSSGILYIWVIALLLSLLNQRYLCFSYAGGIVALSNLITGYPRINAIGILALVGILHLAESLLILVDGHSNAVPGFFKLKTGEIVGGYHMNRVWPLPVLIFFAAFIAGGVGDSVSMPDWWPIIKMSGVEQMDNLIYMLQPIPVVLGYGDIAIVKNPSQKCKESASKLSIYSIVLLTLCIIASKIMIFAYLAALFAPVGHELLILYGQKEEEQGERYFSPSKKGLKVLYAIKDFPGHKMNLNAGDIILKINNNDILNEEHLNEVLEGYPTYIWLDVEKADGSLKSIEYKDYKKGIGNLGIIFAAENPSKYFELKMDSPFFDKLKNKLSSFFGRNE